MYQSTRKLSALACLAASLGLGFRCQSGGIGDPCVPEDEFHQDMGGYSLGEVDVETRSFQCESRICLVNHFQGRVTCPYGQTMADLDLPGTAPGRCRIPYTAGDSPTDQVIVPVAAWNTRRPADQAVYCTCRCAGPEPDARYCTCPHGYSCEPVVPAVGLASHQLEGSYCIKTGTGFEPAVAAAISCRDDPGNPACPGDPLVNP
jgi:hypothetical protein